MHNRSRFLSVRPWLLGAVSVLTLNAAAMAASSRPNVVLVITDDQGYGDLSCHGNPILKTPNLDTLYGQSIRLTDFHVSPTCAPTRGALMSGHFTNRAGPWHTIMGRSMLYQGEKTLGEVFADNGYATGMFGKWHLGDNYPFRPEDRGFGEVVRHGGGGVGQTPDFWDNAYFDDTYFHNGTPRRFEGYCTDVYFREAKRFIAASAAAGKPFFAYISTNAPHSPFHAPDLYWKPYEDKVNSPAEALFFGMIANIDENVGALRDWLKAEGMAEDTVFIFMTDNGTASGAKVFNDGMRGNKGSEYDGGHRVPFFLHWPGGGFDQGLDMNRLCGHIDVLPTLMDLCELPPIRDYAFDGTSILPLLKDPDTAWPERVVITDSQRVKDPIKWRKSATMTDRWRLVNGKELYDIEADPGQQTDVAADHPDQVARLRAAYESWWADISPGFSRDARIIVGNPAENPCRLTCHDWLPGKGGTPWHQGMVRRAPRAIGYWALNVESAGAYRISLRRWPAERALPIHDDLEPGAPVPGLKAVRETPGKGLAAKTATIRIGDVEESRAVDAGDEAAVFDVTLEAGDAYLHAAFTLEDGAEIGAYYADVEKSSDP